MKRIAERRKGFIAITAILCVLGLAGLVGAQDLDLNSYTPGLVWSPVGDGSGRMQPSYDYGNVVIGGSETKTFDLYSAGPSEVWIYVVELVSVPDWYSEPRINPNDHEYTLGAFSFDPTDPVWTNILEPGEVYDAIPMASPPGHHLLVDVTFAPTSVENYSAYLFIDSNDSVLPGGPQLFLHLQGTGIEASVPEPSTLLLLGLGLIGLAGVRRIKK